MIVIGVDTHKRNHMLVAVDGQTGALLGQRAIAASDAGSLDALRFAAGLEQHRVCAIEDCRHVSARLEAALIAAGERMIRVPAAMTSQARKVARQAGRLIRSMLVRWRWSWWHAHVLLTDGSDSYRLAQATAGKGVKPLP